ncbi:MAG: hypothetical protein BGO90_04890 [Legionella sp. 40-6]|nr:hypothetical protein [Legionella sp.]OJY45779.1 MAG: hypothetical protein BGO90_04890 [Legionella sp. 40-6]
MPGMLNQVVSGLTNKIKGIPGKIKGKIQDLAEQERGPLVGSYNHVKPLERTALHKAIGDRLLYEPFSPMAYKATLDEYLPNIGIDKKTSFDATAFSTLRNTRAHDFQGLKEATTASGEIISKKLAEESQNANVQNAKTAVQGALNSALSASPNFESAQLDYEARIGSFKKLLDKVPSTYKIQDLSAVMKSAIDEGRAAITTQHGDEIKKLNQLFTEVQFKTDLKAALNIQDDHQIDLVKESIVNNLKKTHTDTLAAFDKSTQESLTKIHKAAEQELKAFTFIANLHANERKMREMIEKLAAETLKEKSNDNMVVDISENKLSVSSVRLDKLEFIQQLGGNKIVRQQDTDPPVYKLSMGMKLFSPFYYGGGKHKQDLLLLAQTIRATGSESITFNVENFSDPKVAEQRAREAFEAGLKAGFPPEKIKINVNGLNLAHEAQEKSEKNPQKYDSIREKLFAEKPNLYKEYVENGVRVRDELKKLNAAIETPTKPSDEIKKEMEELRKEARGKQQKTIKIEPEAAEQKDTPAPT